MVDHFTARGGELKMNARIKEFVLNPDGSVKHLEMVNGETVQGDLYVSAMPGGRCYAV
jgi:15-cis-phytoene desaturase